MANTVWNTADKGATVTLTGSNLIATAGASSGFVRAVDKQVSGKFYWEVLAGAFTNANSGIGISAPTATIPPGFSSTGAVWTCGVIRSGIIYVSGVNTGVNLGTISSTTVCIACDFAARLVWFRLGAAGNWNANASNNPATGVGGISVDIAVGIPVFPAAFLGAGAETVTANFGDTAFVGAVPSGYTSGFPTSANTVLLVHADGTNGSTTFTDASLSNRTLVAGGTATVSTTSPKFGTGSVDLGAGGNATVSAIASPDWNFGAGEFTVEAWAFFTSTPTGFQSVAAQFAASTDLGWFFGMNSGLLAFFYSLTGTDNPSVSGAFSPTLNQWIHLAADRDTSKVLRVYANGAVIASATVSGAFFNSSRSLYVGNDGNLNRKFPGRLDEIRITKGAARYGGTFTPPTAPFDIGTNAIASQALAEHWLTTNPAAQITQVVVEHWASVASDNLQAVVTQVLIEHWMSVASVSPASGGPQVTMIH